MIPWFSLAFGSSILMAGISIVDKTMLQNYLRSHTSLQFLIGVFQGIVGTSFVLATVFFEPFSILGIFWALLSGAIFGTGGLFLIYVLNTQEVTRTVPIVQTAPVFATLMGFLFLGESLMTIHWIAVFFTTIGAILISGTTGQKMRNPLFQKSFLLLILSSVITAAGQVTGKLPLSLLSIPLTHGFRSIGLSAVFLLASGFDKTAREDAKTLYSQKGRGLYLILFSEVLLVTISFLLFLAAIKKGPVGLVSAVLATRSLFVLIISTVITFRFSNILGENIQPKSLVIKFAAIGSIVFGVSIINIS